MMLRKLFNFKDNSAAGALGIHASLADHKLAQGAKELVARLPAKSEHRLELVGQLSRNLTTSETTNLFPSVTNRTVQRGKVRAKVAGTTATPENYQLKLERLLVPSPIPNAPVTPSNGNPGFAMQVVDPVQHSHTLEWRRHPGRPVYSDQDISRQDDPIAMCESCRIHFISCADIHCSTTSLSPWHRLISSQT